MGPAPIVDVSSIAIGLSKIITILKASAPYIEDAGNLVYKQAIVTMLPCGPPGKNGWIR